MKRSAPAIGRSSRIRRSDRCAPGPRVGAQSLSVAPYRLVEIDLADTESATLQSDDAGLAVVIRDGAAIVGFRMFAAEAVPPTGLAASDLLDADVRAAILAARLRERLRPEMAGAAPTLSVAICTKDRPEGVERLLQSLTPLRAEESFEILVVDNAPSDDRTRDLAAAAEDVAYVREPLAGLDFARNRALAAATGEVVAFLDDDVVVDRSWARALRRAWADNPDAGAITGQVLPMALETEAQVLFELRGGFRRGFRPARWGATRWRDPLHPAGPGQFGAGANMSVRRDLVRALGGFDEALDTGRPLPGGGDLDIFYRVLRAGHALVYEPQAAVFHEHRREASELARQYYTWGLGFAAFLTKSMRTDPARRGAQWRMAAWWVGYQARRVASRLLGREPTPMGMIIGEICGGLKGFCGEYGRSLRRSAAIRAAQGGGR